MRQLVVTLEGQLPSGKNQVKTSLIRGKVIKYPNKRFKAWREQAYRQLQDQRGAWETLREPAIIQARYWPGDLRKRDFPGMWDALFHLLAFCHVCAKAKRKDRDPACPIPIVQDDGLLHSGPWIRMPLDRARPRVELTIVPEPLP